VRLLTYNIKKGGAGREEALGEVIVSADPDVVLLQEATRPDVVARLSAITRMPHWATRPRASLGFLSRIPLAAHAWHRPFGSRHAFVEVVPARLDMRLFGVHLSAVHAAWTERRRVYELRKLLTSIRRHHDTFHVIAGDFNTLAPGEMLNIRTLPYRLRAMVWLSGGAIDWRTIQIVLEAGYVDAYRARGPVDAGVTFPTWAPHVRLDYAFVPARYAPRIASCRVIIGPAARLASDHFPLLVEFNEDG
jgi:exodeoxyribonuclease-3